MDVKKVLDQEFAEINDFEKSFILTMHSAAVSACMESFFDWINQQDPQMFKGVKGMIMATKKDIDCHGLNFKLFTALVLTGAVNNNPSNMCIAHVKFDDPIEEERIMAFL